MAERKVLSLLLGWVKNSINSAQLVKAVIY